MAWLAHLEVEPWQAPRPPLTPAQWRGFFGKLRYSGVWIFRFLDFTTDVDGEAEVLAEIARYGSVEAKTFQIWRYDRRDFEEWGAIGDVSSRFEDRRQGRSPRHQDLDPIWLRRERAAKDFWRHAAGTFRDEKRRLGRCVNCGEAATEKWGGHLWCEDCVPDEALAVTD